MPASALRLGALALTGSGLAVGLAAVGLHPSAPAKVPMPGDVQQRYALTDGRSVAVVDDYRDRRPAQVLLALADGRHLDVTPDGLRVGEVVRDAEASDGALWLVSGDCTDGRGPRVWTSDDGGASWQDRRAPGLVHCSAGSGFDLRDVRGGTSAVLESTVGAVLQTTSARTSDGGRSWGPSRCFEHAHGAPRAQWAPCGG